MAKITLDITARRKRILEAMCEDRDVTMDQLFEPALRDLVENAAGVNPELPEVLQEAIADSVVAKAAAKKAARTNPTPEA